MREFRYRKSSYSDHEAECAEVATSIPRAVAVRDSKDPDGPIQQLDPASWTVFQGAVAGGWFEPQRPRR
ncbi:DUF397 domain-containing protein [Streptomyces sp. NPDC050636]|uniref:DUF397 domain-containing protein n=1 Tax=Streptomyces sp. NPDC050636 TaxID=3154510 RepID=UPI0034262887